MCSLAAGERLGAYEIVAPLGAVALAAAALAGALWGIRLGEKPQPKYLQLTFRRGTVEAAAFAADGHTVLYTASWEGEPSETFSMRLDTLSPRPLGLPGAQLQAVAGGELAILLPRPGRAGTLAAGTLAAGTLARVPLEGGTPRQVLDDVLEADWSAAGDAFAVERRVGGTTRLEFPVGEVLFETAGGVGSPRISPDGQRLAFVDQPVLDDTGGSIVVLEVASRERRTLAAGWSGTRGIAWTPDGSEVWFSAAGDGISDSLYAVTLDGRLRLVAHTPRGVVLEDIFADGRVLFSHAHRTSEVRGLAAGEPGERDFSWFDWTHATDLSADGGNLLFTEEGESAGANLAIFLRQSPGAAPARLGEGHSLGLSPDGRFALAHLRHLAPPELALMPTGPGDARTLPRGNLAESHWAWWFPDGRRLLILGNEAGRPVRLFTQELPDGAPVAVTPEGVTTSGQNPISPDGRWVAALVPGASLPGTSSPELALVPVAGGEPRRLPAAAAGDEPIRWSGDGRFLYVRSGSLPQRTRVYRLDVERGRRESWLELGPADPAGVYRMRDVLLSADGASYMYVFHRNLSDLFLAEGLR